MIGAVALPLSLNPQPGINVTENLLRARYLELLKHCLCGLIFEDVPIYTFPVGLIADYAPKQYIHSLRVNGRDIPSLAHTAIGLKRLNNLQYCLETVLADNIPGDAIETGVWRGGATIFMRGVFKAYGADSRRVWVADSFCGLPEPDLERYPMDAHWQLSSGKLAVSQDMVRANFARYDLLDEQVQFLPGWFKDTLPTAPIEQLAVLRLDGDLYESTMDALNHLYHKLAPGGFIIVDDYCIPSCRQAIDEFRASHGISEPIQAIDGWAVFWRRAL